MLVQSLGTDERYQRFPFTGIGADQVAHAAAVRMGAWQCGEILPGHDIVRLRAKAREHASMREALIRIQRQRSSGRELRLDRYPTNERRLEREAYHVADLVVVHAE